MFSLLSSTLNTGLKLAPVGMINTKCKTTASPGKREAWDQGLNCTFNILFLKGKRSFFLLKLKAGLYLMESRG